MDSGREFVWVLEELHERRGWIPLSVYEEKFWADAGVKIRQGRTRSALRVSKFRRESV